MASTHGWGALPSMLPVIVQPSVAPAVQLLVGIASRPALNHELQGTFKHYAQRSFGRTRL